MPRPAILEGIDAAGQETIIPAMEGGAGDAELFQRAPRRHAMVVTRLSMWLHVSSTVRFWAMRIQCLIIAKGTVTGMSW
jgi:hypothetical protein